jgi:hypothetical protein
VHGVSVPSSGAIAYTDTYSDSSPHATSQRPDGSIAKPRGCVSVGVACAGAYVPSGVRR